MPRSVSWHLVGTGRTVTWGQKSCGAPSPVPALHNSTVRRFGSHSCYNAFVWMTSPHGIRGGPPINSPPSGVCGTTINYCPLHYTPFENLAVDEQWLAFMSKCPIRTCFPNKLAKHGMELIILNDARTKYLLEGIPYPGKDATRVRATTSPHIHKELT